MKVNEIFLSLQGEGRYTGTPSVFVRLSGCNLRCPFCDTDHEAGTELTEQEIADRVSAYEATHVVITGGEPSLFLTDSLIALLHKAGKYVAVETNGTHPLPPSVDWVTLSPKYAFFTKHLDKTRSIVVLTKCDELKVVFTSEEEFALVEESYLAIPATYRYLQPCDSGDAEQNKRTTKAAAQWCMAHPAWSLSLQTHKLIGIQ